MKSSIAILLCILLSTSVIEAQTTQLDTNELRDYGDMEERAVRTYSLNKYKGTPFFNDWTQGHVIINEKTESEPLMLRYDMEANAVMFAQNETPYYIPANKLKGFVIYTIDGNINFRNGFSSPDNDINEETLLRIIYDGNTKFVAHHQSDLKEDLATYGNPNKIHEFVNDTDYYIITENGELNEIRRLRERHVMRVLGDEYEDEIDNFVSSNDLSFREEADLKQIVAYYDKINSQS